MLTILFKILSILGIVLLILLGIALVVILLVLFFPISYKAAGKRTAEEFWITARVKWLFGLLRMNCDYPDPGKICVKFLFFTLYDSSVEKPEKTDRTSTETTGNEKTPASAEQTTEEHTPESVGTPKLIEAEDPTAFSATAADVESAAEREDSGIPEPGTPEPAGEAPGKTTDRLYGFFTRIRYTVRKICDKIKNILENIAFYKNLWNDPDTQGLLKHAGKRFGHIWKRLRPRKLTVNATVGTGSPDTTGYLYGIYGMVLPKLGKGICITPDFEQAILEGDFKASGHFTAACVLFHSVRLLLDRRLRELLHKIRQYQKTQKKNQVQKSLKLQKILLMHRQKNISWKIRDMSIPPTAISVS